MKAASPPAASPGPRLVWWLLPVVLFNLAFTPFLPEGYGGDAGVPWWLLGLENALRVVTFALPLWLRELPDRRRPGRLWVAVGLGVYAASWLPLLVHAPYAGVLVLALGPAVTPCLWLSGLAWLSGSKAYAVVSGAFLSLHVAHQLVSLAG